MGYKRHPMIYGRRCPAGQRPRRAHSAHRPHEHGEQAFRPAATRPASSAACIDPDSRGMTVSVALCTPGLPPGPTGQKDPPYPFSRHSDRQSGDTSECLFYLHLLFLMRANVIFPSASRYSRLFAGLRSLLYRQQDAMPLQPRM